MFKPETGFESEEEWVKFKYKPILRLLKYDSLFLIWGLIQWSNNLNLQSNFNFSFYSDDEFDPKKYDRNSEDDLLASPDHKNDLTGITMNFTVTPKMVCDLNWLLLPAPYVSISFF